MSHCSRSLHLIIDPSELLIWPPLFTSPHIHVHHLLLIYQCHTLLFTCIIADLILELFHNLFFRCKQHHS